MSATVLLRLHRLDEEEGFVLLKVSSGKRPLDLKLIGTEGENVFSVSVKHKDILSLRAEKFVGSQDEFESIVSAVLLGGERNGELEGIEAVAKVIERKVEKKKKPFLNVTIQKRIEGITQKYGELEMPETSEEELPLFEWCAIAVGSKDSTLHEVKELKRHLQRKEDETEKLKDALEELVKVKKAHENDLIEKFSLLLNEKKMKIREQQRLLASSTVDPKKLAAVEQDRVDSHSPGPSRAGKRKAVKDESESEDGFEKMDVDAPQETDSGEDDVPPTPDRSTADEASEDEQVQPDRTRRPVSKSTASRNTKLSSPSPDVLPPKRELPFAKKKAKAKPAEKPSEKGAVEGSETESDDEL